MKNKPSNYFTKKRLITFSILLAIIIVFIALFSKFILDINFNNMFTLLDKSSKTSYFGIWLLLLLVFPAFSAIWRCFIYWIKLKDDKIYVKWYDWLCFAFVTTFINAITPFSMGCEPYNLFWLKSKGVSLKRATIIVSSTIIFWIIAQIIITWPSYFYICSLYGANNFDTTWTIAFWFTTAGLFIDLLSFFIFWSLSYSKRMHYLINVMINFFKRKFRISYKTKEEIRQEFINNASFKKMFKNELKKWKQTLILLIGNIVWNFLYYITLFFAFKFLNNDVNVNFFLLFNYVNVAVTANNFIPIPGSEGTIQLILKLFLLKNDDAILNEELITNSIFIWRLFNSYLPTVIGLFTFIFSIIISVKYQHNIIDRVKKINKKSVVVLVKGDFTNIQKQIKRHNLNIDFMSINYDCSLDSIKKCIQNYDYFIFLDSNDIIRHKYMDNLIANCEDKDIIFASFTRIISKFKIINIMIEKWMNKCNNGSDFIYKNKLENDGVLISVNFFNETYKTLEKQQITIHNNELIYSLFLLTEKIEVSIENYRITYSRKEKNTKLSLQKINNIFNDSHINFRQKVLTINNYKNNIN